MNQNHSLKLVSCGLNDDKSIFVRLREFTEKTTIDDIKKFESISGILGTLGVKRHEKLLFEPLEVLETSRGITKVLITHRKQIVPFEVLQFDSLSHSYGPEEIQERLIGVDYLEAAAIGAEYARAAEIAALKVLFFNKANKEHVVRIINSNIYNKISRGDKRIERVIPVGCLLMKNAS